MLKEYSTPSLLFPDLDNPKHWDTRITIDLRHVTSAEPTDTRSTDMRFTVVTISGSPTRRYLNDDYVSFMDDWRRAAT